jgi:hypothetical protein
LKIKNRTDKKKQTNKIIGLIVIAVISTIIVISAYYSNEQRRIELENQWITSGPFSINKNQYKLGDYVFMSVQNLQPTDVGKIVIVNPKGSTYDIIPFNGTMKTSFKQFFKPNTQRNQALCTPEDLVGEWSLVFQGTSYKSIPFKIIDEWIPGSQAEIKPVPKGLDPC